MDAGEVESFNRRIGLVKATINIYGGSSAMKKPQVDSEEKRSSKAKELHLARKAIHVIDQNKKAAESSIAQAESELLKAKKTVKDLAARIEQSNNMAREQKQQLHRLSKATKGREKHVLAGMKLENHDQYAEVCRDLESMKQELLNQKLDITRALQEKIQAEKETEIFGTKMKSYNDLAEMLRKQIEEANEEHVLVELARIEAEQESAAIEARRKEDDKKFSLEMDERKKKQSAFMEEVGRAQEIESTLAVMNSEIDVLQIELDLVKEMERRIVHNNGSPTDVVRQEPLPLLQSITEELEAAKQDLVSRKQEGFQCMLAIDIVRKEVERVREEISKMKRMEAKKEKIIQNMNSKLLKAKDKVESVTASEEKAKVILSSLSATLNQLKEETKIARREKEALKEEIAQTKDEIKRTESETDSMEEKLQAAMQELEVVKASEAMALDQLQVLTESAMRNRDAAAEKSSKITISKFEYNYLKGSAEAAKETADKKVAAAQGWIESLKNSEKEISMKIEKARIENEEMRLKELKEEQEINISGKMMNEKHLVEGEVQNWRRKQKKSFVAENFHVKASPRKSMKDDNTTGNLTNSTRARFQKSASPVSRRTGRFTSITLRRKKQAMLYISKYFPLSEQIEENSKLEEECPNTTDAH